MFLLLYNFVISFNNYIRGIGAFICIPILKIKGVGGQDSWDFLKEFWVVDISM